ncbi:MAG: MBL fold metallo-hydrolase [Anaerolineae bacterium]|nr:MBL fold metallo-hydrolase [Anaerolineae bacterium]
MMYIKFWGTRGSIPTPITSAAIKQKFRRALEGAAGLNLFDPVVIDRYLERLPFPVQHTVGGNTTCLEVRSGDQLLILDAGSGLRALGWDLMKKGFANGTGRADFLFTHTHWDHIQGFPFFTPAFVPGNHFTFYSPFAELAERLERQQDPAFFPVPVSVMSATLDFKQINPEEEHRIGNFRVKAMRLSHPGVTYGYRIEDDNACLVMATDSEYKRVSPESTRDFENFFKDADLLIFDAQYSFGEALDKLDWGHSTAMMGAEFAHRAKAKRLALFHHDPNSSDEQIWQAKEQADAYLMSRRANPLSQVLVAYDGLCVEI